MRQLKPDDDRERRVDSESFAHGYFEHAVYNHWDPNEDIPQSDLEADREKLIADEPTQEEFHELRKAVAMFGGGEEAVTEDLMPLALVIDDLDDEMFLSTQIYEEAKHLEFWERYWTEVLSPAAEELGFEETSPMDDRYYDEYYESMFTTNERRMHRLLEDGGNTPENRAKAICTYHLVLESVLAQTGYYTLNYGFSPKGDDITYRPTPELNGLIQGVEYIRSDEGRHVGWGMHKVRSLIHEEDVDAGIVQQTLQDMMPDVAGQFSYFNTLWDPNPLIEYSRDKLTGRVERMTNLETDIPPVEDLVRLAH